MKYLKINKHSLNLFCQIKFHFPRDETLGYKIGRPDGTY